MSLRKIIYSAAVAAMAIALGSCTPIDEDDRLIEVEKPQVQRAVLIEDFTGQYCPNCPNAAEEIESLMEAYGSDVIIPVAIHSGPQGFDVKYGTEDMPGLMTDLGNEYYNNYGIDYQPQGVVDKGGKLAYTAWAGAVRNELQKAALLSIHIDSDYAETTRQLTIHTKLTSVKGIEGVSGKLQLWLVEDGIKSVQVMPDQSYDFAYTHNHVFRDAINGTWGEEVSMTEDTPAETTHTYTIPTGWNANHLSVVAFVYGDGGVMQVAKAPIVENANN